jgi:tetratricopeptide (TPR) repeat protein
MASDLSGRFQVARTLHASSAFEPALAAYDSIIRDLEGEPDVASRELCARALVFRGFALRALGRTAEERVAYDAVVGTPPGGSVSLRETVARALVFKAAVLERLGRREEELEVLDAVITREQAATEPAIRRIAAYAYQDRAMVLDRLERFGEALHAYELVLQRYGDDADPECAGFAVGARTYRPAMLRALGRSADALIAYDDLIEVLGSARNVDARPSAEMARLRKGRYLAELGRIEEARVVFRSLADATPDPARDEQVAIALQAGGLETDMLEQLGRSDDALERTRVLLERFSGAHGAEARAQTASILEQYAMRFAAADRADEAIAAHDRLLTLLPALELPDARGREAASSVERACLLLERGDTVDGAEALRTVFARFSADPGGELPQLCAFAGIRATEVLGSLGRKAEAIELAHAVYARFDGSDDPYVRDCVRWVTTAFRQDGRAMRLVRRPPRS